MIFPTLPYLGQIFTIDNKKYYYNGEGWIPIEEERIIVDVDIDYHLGIDRFNGSPLKVLNEQGDFTKPIISHIDLTYKNDETAFQHVDTTTTKETLVTNDKVAILDSETGKIVLTDKTNIKARYLQDITADTFVADSTYIDFPYKCEIPITGVTSANNAEITFSLAQATSGDLAPICVTDTNKVIIYAKSDLGSIVIPLIKVEVVL